MATTRKSAAIHDGQTQDAVRDTAQGTAQGTAALPTGTSASAAGSPAAEAPLTVDFEAALAELETLVAAMEDGDMSLEASLAAYRRGVALSRACQDRLAQAEQQVKVLEGELLKPLDTRYLDEESGS